MNDIEKAKVKRLVARLKDLSERDGCSVPSWMLDENRYGNSSLTVAEQQEWAQSVCAHMRGSVALLYLIECGERWGTNDGEHVFRCGEFAFGITRQLVEGVLIKYAEEDVIQHNPEERYIAVYQFYRANDQRISESGHLWFNDFLDESFTELASRLREWEGLPVNSVTH